MAVDSGACKTVVNPDELPNYEVFETPSSEQVKVSLVHLAMRYPTSEACRYQL